MLFNKEKQEQREAKAMVACILMIKAGVSLTDDVAKRDIMAADTKQDMVDRVDLWASVHKRIRNGDYPCLRFF